MLTCNDIGHAIKTLEWTRDSVGEQIIVDSSGEENQKQLLAYAKTNDKVKVYPILALGIPETCIPFGISRCKNLWILLLDADERPCPEFLAFLKSSVPQGNANYITRYETLDKKFATMQLRLFKKGYVRWLGVPHEHPTVQGRKVTLDKGFYLMHLKSGAPRDYSKMQKIRIFTKERRLRRIAAELYIAIRLNPKSFFKALNDAIKDTRKTKDEKEISKAIGVEGIIGYLGLDRPGEIERLSEKYRNKKQGPELLINLIYEEYKMRNGTVGASQKKAI